MKDQRSTILTLIYGQGKWQETLLDQVVLLKKRMSLSGYLVHDVRRVEVGAMEFVSSTSQSLPGYLVQEKSTTPTIKLS